MKKNYSKTIALFYPYRGAAFSNPTLEAFFSSCEKNNIGILLFTPLPQKRTTLKHSNITEYYHSSNPEGLKWKLIYFFTIIFTKIILWFNKPEIYIGVDQNGLIEANKMGGNLSLGYFSFEILFKDEIELAKDQKLKSEEEEASKKVKFIIVQDSLRHKNLIENNIELPNEIRSFLIPVAPREIEKKIATHPKDIVNIIFSGSFASWSGLDFILDCIEKEQWDSKFQVTFHSRLELSKDNVYLYRIEELKEKGYSVEFSATPFYDQNSFLDFLKKFQIGLGFYFESTSVFTKKNITEIGLASGKLNTYAMLGIPSVTNYSPFLGDLNEEYNFGELLHEGELLIDKIQKITLNWNHNFNGARAYYNNILRPDDKINELVNYILVADFSCDSLVLKSEN